VESAYAQWSGERELARAVQESRETIVERKVPKVVSRTQPKAGTTLGKFQVPRLNLFYVLLEGTSSRTLDKSIGHVEGTAMIGEAGNIGIAGHRNTHFRKLEWIRRGDEVILTGPDGEFRYLVEWARLFTPKDMEVLDPEHGPAVTLVTCFPFEYVGSAPLRFIVRALPDDNTRARLEASAARSEEKPAEE
jgi:sortase A